jgi:transposase InsO family protein
VKELAAEKSYPIIVLCDIAHVAKSAYYKWLRHPKSDHELENEAIAEKIEEIHKAHPEKGYRQVRDDLARDYKIGVSDKRILHLMRILGIQSTIKFKSQGCTKSAADPEHVAENILDRNFYAGLPNEKWLTDVTEFKYVLNNEIHKLYLSAILDLCDRRIVTFVIRDHNDNRIVLDTFDAAVAANPEAHPLFHSDRGFQYTNRVFHKKLTEAGMIQSMSRVGCCIDNGPMEGFWGIIKREKYYGRKFTSREDLVQAITDYIDYYNNRRYQRRLFTLSPMEVYKQLMAA